MYIFFLGYLILVLVNHVENEIFENRNHVKKIHQIIKLKLKLKI